MKAFTKWWRREREDEAMQFKCSSSAFEYWVVVARAELLMESHKSGRTAGLC